MGMWTSLQCYAETGYRDMIMTDHVPTVSGRDPQNTAFALTHGHIRGLLQVLDSCG